MSRPNIIYCLLFAVVLKSCNIAGDCSNRIYKEVFNSNHEFKVVKFDRGCGATTGNSIQLSILKAVDSLPNEGGNLFICNSKVGGYIERDTSVQITWLTNNEILVKYDRDQTVFKKESLIKNFQITYLVK
ncbi:MAG: hypothetical protein IPP15_00880 [Saprospiraceae bacterium]|uniref:Uncharacterized protein n=1 Tax=Candidatus Opimibacter skivensis TaxID=2982028 RepID=A0A9D7SQ24_9BACT|nr:hypothetical protein [Candidatus Opimibacter skivensis]